MRRSGFAWREAIALIAIAPLVLWAQTSPAQKRAFEVASIKPNNSGQPRPQGNPFRLSPGGMFIATNVTLVDLIVGVYSTRRIQMEGGPGWIDSDRFDIVAKADESDGDIQPGQFREMVRVLLEDRFKLKLHMETKDVSVLALIQGKESPKIKESTRDPREAGAVGSEKGISFQRTTMDGLVNTLSNILRIPVIDRTGIKGVFDFTLNPQEFAPDGAVTASNYGDLMVTAVEQQLGFKIERQKAPLDMTIIDHAEKPSEN